MEMPSPTIFLGEDRVGHPLNRHQWPGERRDQDDPEGKGVKGLIFILSVLGIAGGAPLLRVRNLGKAPAIADGTAMPEEGVGVLQY